MSKSILKYISLFLILTYQINVLNDLVTSTTHQFSHFLEWVVLHEHHHHHDHKHDQFSDHHHHNDHHHHLIEKFSASFVNQNEDDANEENNKENNRISVEKHLFPKIELSSILKKEDQQMHCSYNRSILNIFNEIPTPPPESFS